MDHGPDGRCADRAAGRARSAVRVRFRHFVCGSFLLALLAVGGGGCVPPAGLHDRPCPCAPGFVCCDRLQTCQRSERVLPATCSVDGGRDGVASGLPGDASGRDAPLDLSPIDAPLDALGDLPTISDLADAPAPAPDRAPDAEIDRGPPVDAPGTCPVGAGWRRCDDGRCIENGCCADQDCGVCAACTDGVCANQSLGQDRKNECGGRGCSGGRCRECLPADLPVCMGNTRRSCSPEGFFQNQSCELGCAGGVCVTCPTPITCHPDGDGDGFGDPTVSTRICGACPMGQVQNGRDCYDDNKLAYPRGPTSGFDDYFRVHRGDGSFDYTCDGMVETTPPDPEKAVCLGVAPSCELRRMSYDASKCGTLVLPFSCSCDPDCMKTCRLLGNGARLEVACR